jgi:glycosyltransferase involved in cell wall biosynthesis
MRILMFSWEYPPKNVGGLSNHVYNLAGSLAVQGNEVHVITCGEQHSFLKEENSGVNVHRVLPYSLESEDFTKWVMHLNFVMAEEAVKLVNSSGKFDIIHAHDWLSLYSAKLIKAAYNIPMLCTIHATEHGRNSGIRTDLQRYISSAEWMLTYEAWKVIVCSEYMKAEVKDIFNVPEDKVFIIPNGVEVDNFNFEFNNEEFRSSYAQPDEKIIFYVGRHVYEKGIHLLVEAAPDIVNSYNKVKFLIAGQGPMTEELKEKARLLGLEHKFLFLGYVDDLTKNKLLKCADAAVFPSLYEPFGIVALEAMSAGCPVVVSDVGGLKEIVQHEVNGLKIITGSKDSLRDNIVRLLSDRNLREQLNSVGVKETLNNYSWEKISARTIELYEKVKEEAVGTEYEVKPAKAKKAASAGRKKNVVSEAAVEAVSEVVTKKRKKKAAAETAVEVKTDTDAKIKEETPAKPKRTRKKTTDNN